MPIKPENIKRYPSNWKEIREKILKRANNKCEFCGIKNYTIKENGAKVVLTIAHIDQIPEHNNLENLKALCQKCHNKLDMPYRVKNRKKPKPITQSHLDAIKRHHNQECVKIKFIQMLKDKNIIKKIICIETNEIYESISQAAKETGYKIAGISKCCNHKLKTYKNKHWEFYKKETK